MCLEYTHVVWQLSLKAPQYYLTCAVNKMQKAILSAPHEISQHLQNLASSKY